MIAGRQMSNSKFSRPKRGLLVEITKTLVGLPPDFLSRLLALSNLMRLSLLKAAHANLFGAACRKSWSPFFSAQVRPTARRGRFGEPGAPVLCLFRSARAQTLKPVRLRP
jgi:hypothetical protein